MGSCHVLMHRKLVLWLLGDGFREEITFRSMSDQDGEGNLFQCLVESPKFDGYLGQYCVSVKVDNEPGHKLRFTKDEDIDIGAGRGFKVEGEQ